MKQTTLKLLFTLIMFGFACQVTAQPQNESMKWVPLSFDLLSQNAYIYDIKVNTKTKSKTNQFNGVVFASASALASDSKTRSLFLNTHNWKYSFSYEADGSKQFKLSKFKPDNEGFRHLDLSQLGTPPFLILDWETNALLGNIQVLVNAGDYYIVTKQTDLAIQNFRALAKKGDKLARLYARYKLARLLEKGTESDQKEAFDLFKQLLESGLDIANYHLALFYIEGKIVNKDLVKAETLLLMTDKDPQAEILLENLKSRKDDSTWNPRTEGLIVERIRHMVGYKYAPEFDQAREIMNDLIMSQDVDVITQNLRCVYKEDILKGSYLALSKIFNNIFYRVGNTSSFWNACEKFLKLDNCDWMWVYAPLGGMKYKDEFEIYSIPTAVWNALGINNDSSQKLKFTKLIEKWCDIALQTSDSILFLKLYDLIQSTYKFKGMSMSAINGRIVTNETTSQKRWKEVVTDENVLKKINLVLRRKSFGTYK